MPENKNNIRDESMLRMIDVVNITGLSKNTILNRCNKKSPYYDADFPEKLRIGANSVGWRASDMKAWVDALRAQEEVAAQNVTSRVKKASLIKNNQNLNDDAQLPKVKKVRAKKVTQLKNLDDEKIANSGVGALRTRKAVDGTIRPQCY